MIKICESDEYKNVRIYTIIKDEIPDQTQIDEVI